MKRLVLSKRAMRDMDKIWRYWAGRSSEEVADGQVGRIQATFPVLTGQEEAGRLVERWREGMRVFPAGRYMVYYELGRGVLRVLRVVAGERDQAAAWRK